MKNVILVLNQKQKKKETKNKTLRSLRWDYFADNKMFINRPKC